MRQPNKEKLAAGLHHALLQKQAEAVTMRKGMGYRWLARKLSRTTGQKVGWKDLRGRMAGRTLHAGKSYALPAKRVQDARPSPAPAVPAVAREARKPTPSDRYHAGKKNMPTRPTGGSPVRPATIRETLDFSAKATAPHTEARARYKDARSKHLVRNSAKILRRFAQTDQRAKQVAAVHDPNAGGRLRVPMAPKL